MTEDNFKDVLNHKEQVWGLHEQDTKMMVQVLKRWRFRSNATNGTRGMPLWPISLEDFRSSYGSILRYVRDRYAPIGGNIHRSIFVRQNAGTLQDKYELGNRLGRGAYGEVLLVTHKETRERRVCKRCAYKMGH